MPDHPIKKRYAPREPSQDVPCQQCGKVFRASASDIRSGRGKFCRKECRRLSQFRGGDQVCGCCGITFHRCPSELQRGRGVFCSKKCATEATVVAPDPVAYFWAHVIQHDGCWSWTGRADESGYGFVCSRGTFVRAHRLSWTIHYGDIPDGLCVLHQCDNPPCTNPAHLWLGTIADNNADRDAKGRSARGTANGRSGTVLTDTLVAEIRGRYAEGGVTQDQLAIMFGVQGPRIKSHLNYR